MSGCLLSRKSENAASRAKKPSDSLVFSRHSLLYGCLLQQWRSGGSPVADGLEGIVLGDHALAFSDDQTQVVAFPFVYHLLVGSALVDDLAKEVLEVPKLFVRVAHRCGEVPGQSRKLELPEVLQALLQKLVELFFLEC